MAAVAEARPAGPPTSAGTPGLPVPALLVVAALSAGIAARGGYDRLGQWALALLLGAAGVTALVGRRWSAGDGSLPLVPAGALAAWALVSAALSGDVTGARSTLGLLAGVVVVLVVARRTTASQRHTLTGAAIAVGALAAWSGWIGVAFRASPWAVIDQGLWRAATPITYSNAAAGLLVPLALLALARLVDRPRSPVDAVAVAVLLTGAGATLSRGGGLALALGAATLALLVGPVALLRAASAPVLGAVIALAGLAPTMPADRVGRPGLAVAALIVGLLAAASLVLLPGTVRRRAGAAGVVVGLALLAVAGSTGALDDVRGPRLSLSSPDRAHEVGAALDVAASHPLAGAGPGGAVLTWEAEGGQAMTARYAHNEYVQVLAELGVVGLALLLALLGALALGVHRGRAHGPSRAVWAGVVAGLVAFAAHSALDFLWHLPVLPLTAALLIGLTTTPHQQPTDHQQETA